MTLLRAACFTDVGKVRQENEDRYLFNETAMFFGVADGVGGLPGGAEAAQATVDSVASQLLAVAATEPLDLVSIVARANDAVVELGLHMSPGVGIGSTLTFGCIRGSRIHLAHVGDSRAFSLRNGQLTCLTEDHSVENEAKRRRARGEVVYYNEAHRGALTRCMGQPSAPDVDLLSLPLRASDRYVFCTDGVTRMVTEKELRDLVGQGEKPEQIARDLVSLAVERGGPDNATVVAVIIDAA